MFDQLFRISFTPRTRLATKINEVIGVVVSLSHDIVLSVVQERQELIVEASLAFTRELVP